MSLFADWFGWNDATPTRTLESAPINDGWFRHEPVFDAGEPRDFSEYKGQNRVKEILDLVLKTAHLNVRPKILLVGPAGTGKTALIKIFARLFIRQAHAFTHNEYRDAFGRYCEATPAMLRNKQSLDYLMGNVRLWDVIFIDEVHMFERDISDTLLPALANNTYPFPTGMHDLPEDFVWAAATTDVGLLPEAFQDRFQILYLEPLSLSDLIAIVKSQPFPSVDDAAVEMAKRCAGYPRDLKTRIYARSRDVAMARGGDCITLVDTHRAFELLGLDENGLYPIERQILAALYQRPKMMRDGTPRYAQSERTIRTLTGLDENYFKQLEGKLLRLNFLGISSSGRELTDKAITTYFRG